jgi:hypothetical protein
MPKPMKSGALMADPNASRLERRTEGDPMPKPTKSGALMADPNASRLERRTEGEPMPTPIEPSLEAPTHGDPMTDDDTLPGFPREEFARAQLTGIATTLGHDEVRVLTRIAERLQGGQLTYGPLDLATDPRQFRAKEAREELEDALVYLACAWLKTETRNLEVNR